ncbi:MAG: PQQ-binding-like beta-propeller repeat protein [Saprospiraceae bacterium]|nr:PQQ-binding-like beta-propeller repeat protein [Saprospiraceae bacterium]
MKKLFLLFLCIVVLSTCSKLDADENGTPTTVEMEEEEDLSLLWSTPINAPHLECASSKPISYNGNVIYSRKICNTAEIIEMRRASDGELIWSWEDYLIPSSTADIGGMRLAGDKLIFPGTGAIYVVDANTGTTLWRDRIEQPGVSNSRINIYNKHIYHAHKRAVPNDTIIHIVRSPIRAPEWDTLLTLNQQDGAIPIFDAPAFRQTEAGEDHMIFTEKHINFSNFKEFVNLTCFSLSANEEVWSIDSLDWFANVSEPLIFDNRVVVAGHHTIYCIDADTGQEIWRKAFDATFETFASTPPLYAENRLIIKPDNLNIYALNPATGAVIWKQENVGASCDPMSYYDGVVYYSCLGSLFLHGIHVQTGQEVVRQSAPRTDFSASAVGIDSENGLLYAPTWIDLNCYELKPQ